MNRRPLFTLIKFSPSADVRSADVPRPDAILDGSRRDARHYMKFEHPATKEERRIVGIVLRMHRERPRTLAVYSRVFVDVLDDVDRGGTS